MRVEINLLAIICLVLLLFPTIFAIDNFNISSSSGNLFFVNGTSDNVGSGVASPNAEIDINGTENLLNATNENVELSIINGGMAILI